jgi:hypothetical protein
MTRNDTKRMLDKVCRLYITQAKKMTSDEMRMMLDSWHETFRSDSYDDVDRAVGNYVKKGNAFMPLVGDIIKEMSAVRGTKSGGAFTETDKLFGRLVRIADTVANNKERISTTDPGGFRWDDELQRKVYRHAETIVSTTSFTQYDFKQLPDEIQEYVEDIEGLKAIWPEIESSREMARRRFQMALPEIRARVSERMSVRLADMWEAIE